MELSFARTLPCTTMTSEACYTTVQHEGTPSGETITVAGVETYKTGSTSSNKVILFFTDVYGPFYVNNQLLMDYFASNGSLYIRCY
jgi:hypothetical protein